MTLALVPITAVLVIAGMRWLDSTSSSSQCPGGFPGADPGGTAIFGPQSDGCVGASLALDPPQYQQPSAAPETNALTFPAEVIAAAGEGQAESASQPSRSRGGGSGAGQASLPAGMGGGQQPPPAANAFQLLRRLGLPLPELPPNGTFAGDGPVATNTGQTNQSSGAFGAPSNVLKGTINGSSSSQGAGPARDPSPQGSSPAGSAPAPPPPGEGEPGTIQAGSPGLPGN